MKKRFDLRRCRSYGIMAAFVLAVMGCSSSENFTMRHHHVSYSPAPVRVWDPEYYVYKNGEFQFVQGGYRPVINRKQYIKRTFKGYMYKVR